MDWEEREMMSIRRENLVKNCHPGVKLEKTRGMRVLIHARDRKTSSWNVYTNTLTQFSHWFDCVYQKVDYMLFWLHFSVVHFTDYSAPFLIQVFLSFPVVFIHDLNLYHLSSMN